MPPTLAETIQTAVDKVHDNAKALEDIVNGPESGMGSDVNLPKGGSQKTIAKAIKEVLDSFESNAVISQVSTTRDEIKADRQYVESVAGRINRKAIVFSADGQSNMAGNQAEVTSFAPEDLPLPNMYQMSRGQTKSYYDQKGYGSIIPADQTLQFPHNVPWFNDGSREVSLAFYFAKAYAEENLDTDVHLICNAIGATGFSDNTWGRGDTARRRSCLEAKSLLARLRENYSEVTYGGIIMHQGENDTNTDAAANVYAAQLHDSFAYAREVVDEGDFPIVIGTMLADFIGTNPRRVQVDAVHRAIAANVPNASFADLSGLTDSGINDFLHFGVADLRLAGPIYYEVWKTLTIPEKAKPIIQVSASEGVIVNEGINYENSSFVPDVVANRMLFDGSRALRFDESLPVGPFTKIIVCKLNALANKNLISHHSTSDNGLIMSMFDDSGTVKLAASSNTGFWPPPYGKSILGTSALTTTGIKLYALTFDGSKLRLYIDGVLETEQTETDLPDVLLRNVSIGEYRGSNFLDADVYFAAVYSGVVGTTKMKEILTEYGTDVTAPVIAHRWNLTDLTDSVGSNDLTTVSGAAEFVTDDGVDLLRFSGDSFATGVAVNGSFVRVVRYRTTTNDSGNLLSGESDGAIPMFFHGGALKWGNISSGQIAPVVAGTDWIDGNWHTIAASYNVSDNTTKLAVDGVIVGTGSQPITLGGLVTLGSYGSTTLRFTGDINFCEIYDGAPTDAQLIAFSQKTST